MNSKTKAGCCSKKIIIDQEYIDEAIHLAERYPDLLKELEFQKELRSGKEIISKEEVLEELTKGAVHYDTDHVQTSNLSNIPLKIALLMEDGYVEKRNEQLRRQMMLSEGDFINLQEQVDTFNKAVLQMEKADQIIFLKLYYKRMTFNEIKASAKNELYNQQIVRAKKRALFILAKEIMMRRFYAERG